MRTSHPGSPRIRSVMLPMMPIANPSTLNVAPHERIVIQPRAAGERWSPGRLANAPPRPLGRFDESPQASPEACIATPMGAFIFLLVHRQRRPTRLAASNRFRPLREATPRHARDSRGRHRSSDTSPPPAPHASRFQQDVVLAGDDAHAGDAPVSVDGEVERLVVWLRVRGLDLAEVAPAHGAWGAAELLGPDGFSASPNTVYRPNGMGQSVSGMPRSRAIARRVATEFRRPPVGNRRIGSEHQEEVRPHPKSVARALPSDGSESGPPRSCGNGFPLGQRRS